MQKDEYSIMSKYYDESYDIKKDLNDIPFYMDLVQRQGGPVLEIACGTGRVLLPMARAGYEIDGIDGSGVMLDLLSKSLEQESQEVRSRVTVHQGDMRQFNLGKKFRLITIPFRPMQHMYTIYDQIAALTQAKNHLADDGLLAFDVFFPRMDLIQSKIGDEVHELTWESRQFSGRTIKRYFKKESIDLVHQIFEGQVIFRSFERGQCVLEEIGELKMNYYTYPQLELLFERIGLEIVEQYGSYDKKPLDNNAENMMFVLRMC